jgi:DNA-binding CsgD family transcriptional regulator
MTYVDVDLERPDTTAWATLTKAERTLSALVAKGMTNRQVGERLFISRHTVDAHLRHIFASSASTHASASLTRSRCTP